MTIKMKQKLFICTLFVIVVIVCCAPTPSESRRVIFHAPRRIRILTSQILSTHGKEEPCEKCHMRDHRGHCRRILSYNADGIKC